MATMTRGSVTFDAVNDDELAKAVAFKAKHEKELEFDPSQLKKAHKPSDPHINPQFVRLFFATSNHNL
jgi:hypothetical protein